MQQPFRSQLFARAVCAVWLSLLCSAEILAFLVSFFCLEGDSGLFLNTSSFSALIVSCILYARAGDVLHSNAAGHVGFHERWEQRGPILRNQKWDTDKLRLLAVRFKYSRMKHFMLKRLENCVLVYLSKCPTDSCPGNSLVTVNISVSDRLHFCRYQLPSICHHRLDGKTAHVHALNDRGKKEKTTIPLWLFRSHLLLRNCP